VGLLLLQDSDAETVHVSCKLENETGSIITSRRPNVTEPPIITGRILMRSLPCGLLAAKNCGSSEPCAQEGKWKGGVRL
jgi:hypothetical protein